MHSGAKSHHQSWRERFATAPPAPENPTPIEAMAWRLRTPQGKKLYGLRKQTPEPVFGIIKSVMGFRQFLLRGLDCVRGEWSLVTMAWNMKRMYALSLSLALPAHHSSRSDRLFGQCFHSPIQVRSNFWPINTCLW